MAALIDSEVNGRTTWSPSEKQQKESRLWDFMLWVRKHRDVQLSNYRETWRWSVEHLSDFWGSVREYFGVLGDGFTGPALAEEKMPGAVWYPEARLNFAENVLRHARDPRLADSNAVLTIEEDGSIQSLSWRELETCVASFAERLRQLGVQPGDRVAAVLPNIKEALIGLLAVTSVGAIWTINSPDLSSAATLDRLRQIAPKVLIGVESYRFNGKQFDTLKSLKEIEAGLPDLMHTILVRNKNTGAVSKREDARVLDFAGLLNEDVEPSYLRVPFNHPLWILFSSGTTGTPKGIVHGHGGMTLESLKNTALNLDMGPGDIYYVAANTSWMVWNTLVNNLMSGASVVTYSGSPTFNRKDHQFEIIAQTGATMFATGAAYLTLVEKAALSPGRDWDLTRLRAILSTGSPLPDSTWLWVHENVKADVHLGSDSGGTDICSGFIGSNPLEPVHLGELQGPQLGVAVEARTDAGSKVIGELGEMVITRPMPSMPVTIWGDVDGSRYHAAYFEKFSGAWTQGDWITETEAGAFIVHGRSDATLNRQGVRLGSADIYSALQFLPEIAESLVIGLELPDGGYYMPLFVVLSDGSRLTDDLKTRIMTTIRARASARHVPDEIIAAPAVPITHALKKFEVPIKKLFAGYPPSEAINLGTLANPEAVDWYIKQACLYRGSLPTDMSRGGDSH